MSKYIFSTLANDNLYAGYVKGGADLPRLERQVLIKGGAGVAGRDQRMITPRGVVTEVTDSEYEFLKTNVVFKRHQDTGFIKIEDRAADPEQVAADMTGRDNSAPLVDADFDAESIKVPTHSGKNQGKHGGRR